MYSQKHISLTKWHFSMTIYFFVSADIDRPFWIWVCVVLGSKKPKVLDFDLDSKCMDFESNVLKAWLLNKNPYHRENVLSIFSYLIKSIVITKTDNFFILEDVDGAVLFIFSCFCTLFTLLLSLCFGLI